MAFEMTVGLFVADPARYAQYRAEIAPLLLEAGGGFRYDFEVARTLRSESGHEINRVFVLRFPDRETKERFFGDPRYLAIRSRLFEPSVRQGTIVAQYEA